ncbi:hypothetical protein [Roseateles sp.]|uniref:hypothetical protein n=1 Tax=Roseateles sp. TaxID=1971397 RepID=UPI00286B0186|nr:hypothetical protein [Roseateles sp.]
MQNTQNLSLNLQLPAQGPVEIDVQLLSLVGGGLPKSTWGAVEANVSELSPLVQLPKSTW